MILHAANAQVAMEGSFPVPLLSDEAKALGEDIHTSGHILSTDQE